MPNWCTNNVSMWGSAEDLTAVEELVRSDRSKFDFDKVIPYPEPYRSMDANSEHADGFNAGGYDWCIANWGTKWWVPDCDITYSGVCEYAKGFRSDWSFLTAWAPPNKVIYALSEKFPNVKFLIHYEEEGMGFEGMLRVFHGAILEDWCKDVSREVQVNDFDWD